MFIESGMEERYRKFVDALYAEGFGDDIKLPQIAVMGDTSSGKSSLLSMLSGIEFPSSDKLTTRCPTRLHMKKDRSGSNAFYAKVDIYWRGSYKDKGKPFKPRILNSPELRLRSTSSTWLERT
jgi:ABC-type antimicrobial peptide transport system ATPase subunit